MIYRSMNTNQKWITNVPKQFQKQGVRFLVLEEDKEDTKGWFLFGHRDLDEGSIFDSWHAKLEEAKMEAEK